MTGREPGPVRDLAPRPGGGAPPPPSCAGCDLASVMVRKRRESVAAAWAGVLAAVLGTISWTTLGMGAGGLGGIAFGLYARSFAPREATAAFAAGGIALVVLALRLAGWL